MIAILSDVHGNYEALISVMNKLDKMTITQIYCLGDIIGYYPQINECCYELRKREVKCVMGNHEWYMLSGTKCLRSQSVNDCLEYQRRVIEKDNLNWINTFPIIRNEYGISMVHGGWQNPIDEYLELDENYFSEIRGKVFVSGHSHIQQMIRYRDKIYCNPGSVGQPRDGDNRAAFAVYDGKEFELYRVEYDIEKVCKQMSNAGFNSYYYNCLHDASKKLHS